LDIRFGLAWDVCVGRDVRNPRNACAMLVAEVKHWR
jgi:hypothetical protein